MLMNRNLPIFKQTVAFITSKVSPDRIILFGSYARGNHGKHSDKADWLYQKTNSTTMFFMKTSTFRRNKLLKKR